MEPRRPAPAVPDGPQRRRERAPVCCGRRGRRAGSTRPDAPRRRQGEFFRIAQQRPDAVLVSHNGRAPARVRSLSPEPRHRRPDPARGEPRQRLQLVGRADRPDPRAHPLPCRRGLDHGGAGRRRGLARGGEGHLWRQHAAARLPARPALRLGALQPRPRPARPGAARFARRQRGAALRECSRRHRRRPGPGSRLAALRLVLARPAGLALLRCRAAGRSRALPEAAAHGALHPERGPPAADDHVRARRPTAATSGSTSSTA